MVEVTEKLIDDVSKKFVQDYIHGKKIEEFFNYWFSEVEYHYQENSVEVFIKDKDLENYQPYLEGEFSYPEFELDFLSTLVDEILKKEWGIEVGGEGVSWIVERLLEKNVSIHKKSDMIQQIKDDGGLKKIKLNPLELAIKGMENDIRVLENMRDRFRLNDEEMETLRAVIIDLEDRIGGCQGY